MQDQQIDTIVVAANEQLGTLQPMLQANHWHSIQIAQDRHASIQYIAIYEKQKHAITSIAPVRSIALCAISSIIWPFREAYSADPSGFFPCFILQRQI